MSSQKILDLIPASLHEQLKKEVLAQIAAEEMAEKEANKDKISPMMQAYLDENKKRKTGTPTDKEIDDILKGMM